MVEPGFDLAKAQRWFAVEANNAAWDLVEQPTRTPDEIERMLHAAHAAWFHWSAIGSDLHRLRAATLLTMAYVVANAPAEAVRHARRGLERLPSVAHATAFDVASMYGSAAQAHRVAGDAGRAHKLRQQAVAAAAAIDDPDEQATCERLFLRSQH